MRRGGLVSDGPANVSGGAIVRLRVGAIATAAAALLAVAIPSAAHAACEAGKVTPNGPCGMGLEEAFSHYTTGNPEEVVAYIEGGVNWHVPIAKGFVNNIYVNWHETPVPCTGPTVAEATMVVGGVTQKCATVYSNSFADYDVNHDGVVNVQDWANDPRVHEVSGAGYLNPEDLIASFSNNVNHDGNGYPNDISGWNFYNNQNDPANEDSTYEHSDVQMAQIHKECPKCMIMPIRAGNEALDRTDDLAQAWLYAGDAGASVIVSVTADLGYSSFMTQAISHLEKKGVVMVEASNDFDSIDHQGGMFHPYVLPGNGADPSLMGEEEWTRSDFSSWGAHNVLTVADPAGGGTTSEDTPTLGGVIALTQAYSREAAAKGLIPAPLSGPETVQEMIATAKPITDESLPWAGGPGEWNPQYGYGIPNAYKAMQKIAAGSVPPVARIESPEWFSLDDPTLKANRKMNVTGTITDRGGKSFKYVLEAGLGPNPQSWITIGKGKGHGTRSGKLGRLKAKQIPESFWRAAFALSSTKELETAEQYTVQLRLKVTDKKGRVGVDRRAISVAHDPSWLAGFPLKVGPSGESQPALVDLQGTGRLDAVFATADGYVEAIDPVTHQELPGWPVHANPTSIVVSHEDVNPGYEAILSDVAVGDLQHNGNLSVVAATEAGKVFVWNAHGELQPGWPQAVNTGVTPLPIPRPALPFTRLPVPGVAVGGPVLYDLQQTGRLDVIVAGWDGYLHVWEASGSNAPGWPVKVELPAGTKPESEYNIVNDQKLDTPPAIAYLEGRSSPPDLVLRPQYTETKGGGLQPLPYAFVFAYKNNGTMVNGWPVKLPGVIEDYGSAQEFITEGTSAPVAADPTGTGLAADAVALAPIFSPVDLISGEGKLLSTYGPTGKNAPTTFTTSAAFGKVGEVMSASIAEIGASSFAVALAKPESGEPIEGEEASFPAAGGSASPGFPAKRQGLDFLGEPIIAPVTAAGGAAVVDGGDSSVLQANGTGGAMAEGFPKWTTGWTVFSPAAGDLLSNGKTDIVSTTREGYLFAWPTNGPASANSQWWRYQHDEWNTGNYEAVTRPPGVIRNGSWSASTRTATFTAPGAMWYEGKPSSYEVTLEPQATTETVPATAAAGATETIHAPAGTTGVVIQAVGPSGLLGQGVSLG
jgi:hypothetical protein